METGKVKCLVFCVPHPWASELSFGPHRTFCKVFISGVPTYKYWQTKLTELIFTTCWSMPWLTAAQLLITLNVSHSPWTTSLCTFNKLHTVMLLKMHTILAVRTDLGQIQNAVCKQMLSLQYTKSSLMIYWVRKNMTHDYVVIVCVLCYNITHEQSLIVVSEILMIDCIYK